MFFYYCYYTEEPVTAVLYGHTLWCYFSPVRQQCPGTRAYIYTFNILIDLEQAPPFTDNYYCNSFYSHGLL